jgi:hypothetical protein
MMIAGASPLNALLATNSASGIRSLAASQPTRADQAQQAQKIQAQSLTVRAPAGNALVTQYDYEQAAGGQQYVSGVTITARPVGQEQPARRAPIPAAFTQEKTGRFSDVVAPKPSLSPADELQLFNSQPATQAAVPTAQQAARKQAQIAGLYARNNDLVYTVSPVFDAAA